MRAPLIRSQANAGPPEDCLTPSGGWLGTARPWGRTLVFTSLLAAAPAAWSLDLLKAYEAARGRDAQWLAAQAHAAAGQERLPQAEAALRPSVSVNASRSLNDLSTSSTGSQPASADRYPSGSYALTLRQPLVNLALHAQRARALAQTDEAEATLRLEQQNMALRVVGAYLDALSAQDEIALAQTQGAFYARQLDAARKLLAAGAGTRTDIDDVQARLDMANADELAYRQNAAVAARKLQALTREPVDALAPLIPARLAMESPPAGSLDDSLTRVELDNPEMRVAKAQQAALAEEVRRLRAGHAPTLDAIVQWSRGDRDNSNAPQYRTTNKLVGVQLNLPLYSGGGVASQVRQALAELESSSQAIDALRQDLSVRLHKEHAALAEGVSRVRALESAERSATQALASSQKSYAGGSRTVLDVLNAELRQATAVRDLGRARYGLLMARARLLALTDRLGIDTLTEMNALFSADQ